MFNSPLKTIKNKPKLPWSVYFSTSGTSDCDQLHTDTTKLQLTSYNDTLPELIELLKNQEILDYSIMSGQDLNRTLYANTSNQETDKYKELVILIN